MMDSERLLRGFITLSRRGDRVLAAYCLVNSSTGEARKTEMPETPRQRLCFTVFSLGSAT